MKNRIVVTFALFLMVVATGLQASPNPASTGKKPSDSTFQLLGAKAKPGKSPMSSSWKLIPFDPSGDGINACSADDCRVCNNNGLMCTPTSSGCNCEFWPPWIE